MKKIVCSLLFLGFFISAQATFGTPVVEPDLEITVIPDKIDIPIIKGKASNKPAEFPIAEFVYLLPGEIKSASIEGQWGGKNITNIRKLDLYLGDILLIDFDQYYRGLTKGEKKALQKSLKHGEMIDFDIDIDEGNFGYLEHEKAVLYLEGKPKFFKYLKLEDITLRIIDPVPRMMVTPVPEPGALFFVGCGLVGLVGLGRKFKK